MLTLIEVTYIEGKLKMFHFKPQDIVQLCFKGFLYCFDLMLKMSKFCKILVEYEVFASGYWLEI